MALARQIEELVLLKCSLLPSEILEFVLPRSEDCEAWTHIVNAYSGGDHDLQPSFIPSPAQFIVKVHKIPIWFKIDFPDNYPSETPNFNITVRGYNISRVEQQRWQNTILENQVQPCQTEFPAYELISLHLLPQLHEEYDEQISARETNSMDTTTLAPLSEPVAHALLTSHHLKSPQKRRSLHQWSSELGLYGFSKVGYPGLIYCSGLESNVREFVSRVKAMQWLALRVRFEEVLPEVKPSESEQRSCWVEVEKVGEVLDEMRKLGRVDFVLDLGIGSGGAK